MGCEMGMVSLIMSCIAAVSWSIKLSSSGGLEGSGALVGPDCMRFSVSICWNLAQSVFLKLFPGVV